MKPGPGWKRYVDTGSRAPRGARGLKLGNGQIDHEGRGSRPARGAWIETCKTKKELSEYTSRPARGAWIETMDYKWLEARRKVAPRAGRVD